MIGNYKVPLGQFSKPLSKNFIILCSWVVIPSIIIFFSGAKFSSSILLCFAVFAQWLPGAVIWNWVRKTRKIPGPELLGMGLAIGTILTILESQLLRTTRLNHLSWLLPLLVAIPIVVVAILRGEGKASEVKSFTQKEFLTLLPTISLGAIQLLVWWRWNPISWSGWWKFQIDVPYIESFSNSLALLGTTESLMNPLQNSRYHWFAYAWIGNLNNIIEIEPIVVVTRLFPLVALIMSASLAYAWANLNSERSWIPPLAAFIIVAGPGLSIGSFVLLQSPGSAMATGWSLAFCLVLFEIISNKLNGVRAYGILIVLAAGTLGGKATTGALIGGAVTIILIVSCIQKSHMTKQILLSCILSICTLLLTYKVLISTNSNRPLQGGIFLGWPGLFLSTVPLCVGLYSLFKFKITNLEPILVFAFSIFCLGSVGSLFTYHTSGNQIYFLCSAAAICVVPSLVGIERLFNQTGFRSDNLRFIINNNKVKIIVLFFFSISSGVVATTIWLYSESDPSTLGKIGRTLSPLPIWIVCVLVFIFLFYDRGKTGFYPKMTTLIVSLTLMFSSLVSSVTYSLASQIKGPIYSKGSALIKYGPTTESAPGAVNKTYFQAGEWVKANIPRHELFFTNRQCMDATQSYDYCDGLWFYASALTKHRFIVEGFAYSSNLWLENRNMSDLQSLSLRFSLEPTLEDLRKLWDSGVRWGWIDHQVYQRTNWKELASIAYSNRDITIIRLSNPEMT